jgi:hypothetical protein
MATKQRFFSPLALIIVLFVLMRAVPGQTTASAHLRFVPTDDSDPGQFSLVIDRAQKLAGLKVTLSYDTQRLSFVAVEKAHAVSSFMHVVNDTIPGTLIIVMASANGISGTDVELLHLHFRKIGNKQNLIGKISITQIELMAESLQEIRADTPEYVF